MRSSCTVSSSSAPRSLAAAAPSALRSSALASVVALLALAAPNAFWLARAAAQEPEETSGEVRTLSLEEAIAMGLRNNLDVEVNRYDPHTARLDYDATWGAYDPMLNGDVNFGESRVLLRSGIPGIANSKTVGGSVGVSALLPYLGSTLSLTFKGEEKDTESPTIVGIPNPNPPPPTNFIASTAKRPEDTASLTATANIPLLKGLIWNEAWTAVKTTKLGLDSANETFAASIMDTVQAIISAYWNLVAAKEQERVAQKSLESTSALLDQTNTQYEVGVVSKVAVVEAEAGVAGSEFNLIVARNDHQNAQDALISAVLGPQLQASTALAFDTTENPQYQGVPATEVGRSVEIAFAKRPEIAALKNAIEQGELQLKYARNQLLPQLDASLSYSALGFGDDIDESAGTFDEFRNYTVKGVFSIPLPNTTARKKHTKARIQLRKANSELSRLKQGIILEVRAAARGVVAAAQGVEAAERRRLAAEEQLRAERIRLEHGESTPFEVLQRDRDLVEAESQKITALKAFRISQVALERAQGTILESRNIVVEDVAQLR